MHGRLTSLGAKGHPRTTDVRTAYASFFARARFTRVPQTAERTIGQGRSYGFCWTSVGYSQRQRLPHCHSPLAQRVWAALDCVPRDEELCGDVLN